MSAEMTQAQLATAAEHLMAAKMFSLASCVMLFYDIAITFGDEVERIWKQRFTGATVLWFLNRYLSPLGYIVIIVSFHDPSWSKAACQRYVLYPEVLKVFTATTVGIIFILRLYAIYSKSKAVLYGFTALLLMELGIKIWAFTDGAMLQLPPAGFVGCILTGKSSPGDRIIYTWVAELVFDSFVFFATLYRTIQLYRRTLIGQALSLITVIMRDGIMYFAVIFVSNLVTVLIFVFAPPDLKVINASFSTLITSLMVSRLMLNLRGEVLRRGPVISSHHSTSHNVRDNVVESYQLGYTKQETETGWSAFSSIVGNLGAPVITFEAENSSYYDDFNEDEDDVIDPGFLQTIPHNSKSTRKPLPHIPHVYPPPPHSPRSADRMRKTYDSHSFHSRQLTESSDETMGWTKVSMPDTPPPSGPSSPTLRSVNRQPSAESSSSASAFNFAALPRKTKLARLKSLSRPRTADSATSERDVVEMMQTRSMPAPLVVQVTEEVVVDHVPDEDDGGQDPKSAEGGSGSRNRKPWLAPPSWRLSRDGHYEEG